ncbi:DUF3265 domain-containing protein [Vibrio parahaemolyticus]|nr:DUF3265 domain-containing protein [Vibrio parahaemolyticus]
MTKRSRGTWHAWHFYYALSFVFKALCGNLCIACLRPLTRRYTNRGNLCTRVLILAWIQKSSGLRKTHILCLR